MEEILNLDAINKEIQALEPLKDDEGIKLKLRKLYSLRAHIIVASKGGHRKSIAEVKKAHLAKLRRQIGEQLSEITSSEQAADHPPTPEDSNPNK